MVSAGIKKALCGALAALALLWGMAFCGGWAAAAELRAGHTVRFGEWYGEPLVWYVLAIDGRKAMLMLKDDQLPHHKFNETFEPVSWETCSLRQWLNSDFFHAAFSSSEQERILTVNVPAHKNPRYDVDPGNYTMDRVFLLSVQELERLLPSQRLRGFNNTSGEAQWWWLRSPCLKPDLAAIVPIAAVVPSGGLFSHHIGDFGIGVHHNGPVRPVMWVTLPQESESR